MSDVTPSADTLRFKDRKGGLIAFGIIQVIAGVFCLLMVPLMVFGMSAASRLQAGSAAPLNGRTMLPAVLVYLVMAVWSVWMGIGSILARRWARAILLVTSWYWLACGIMAMGFMFSFLPAMYEQMGKNGQMPQHVVAIMKYVMLVVMMVMYIVIPGVFILFYGSRHVKATCEYRDPHIRWTDRCPLPVLGVSLMAGCMAACLPAMGIYGWAVPFFGTIVTGVRGAGLILIVMVLLGTVTRGLYKLSLRAWWLVVLLVVGWGASCVLTFSRVGLMDFYAKMNLPAEQLAMMKSCAASLDATMAPFCGVWLLVALGYLVYIRRYLTVRESDNPAGTATSLIEPIPPFPPPVPVVPTPSAPPSGGLAVASCVMGILALVLGIFVIGGIFGIVGLILGIIHLVRNRSRRVLAGWGIGLSIAGCLLATAIPILCFVSLKSYKAMPHMTPGQRYAQAVKELSDPATPEYKRFYTLNQAEKDAFNLGKKEEARAYAEEQSRMLDRYKTDWNYGNAVQDVNLVLGRIAVSEGKLDQARDYLLKAGDSPGSPQMNSFGPNMSLAKDLLEKGEKQVVLQYFKKCAKFWKMDYGRLNEWAKQVESGQIPEFGANLLY